MKIKIYRAPGFARLIRDTRSIENALGEPRKYLQEEIEMQKSLDYTINNIQS